MTPTPTTTDLMLQALRLIAVEASNNYPDALARISEIAAAAVVIATAEVTGA